MLRGDAAILVLVLGAIPLLVTGWSYCVVWRQWLTARSARHGTYDYSQAHWHPLRAWEASLREGPRTPFDRDPDPQVEALRQKTVRRFAGVMVCTLVFMGALATSLHIRGG